MTPRFGAALLVLAHAATTLGASADAPAPAPRSLRGRFGIEVATRLLRSPDPAERLRGVERVRALGNLDAVAVLAQAVDGSAALRSDSRAALAAARALGPHAQLATARAALGQLARVSSGRADDAASALRFELARRVATLALAAARDAKSSETLLGLLRATGPGQAEAVDALVAHPPATLPLGAGSSLSTAEVAVAIRTSDLRTIDTLEAAGRWLDPNLRAAALVALGELGDRRAEDLLRRASADTNLRVRVAAVRGLVLLGASNTASLVADLVRSDATAAAGISLGELLSDDAVVGALVERIAAPEGKHRRAALAALGRSPAGAALGALVTFAERPSASQGEAFHALARSPAAGAMGAIEGLAEQKPTRRLATRAYIVRAYSRREASSRCEHVLDALRHSPDASDRALGRFGNTLLGRDGEDGLDDADPRVRRATAMALASAGGHDDALLRRAGGERDGATTAVLLAGLRSGDPRGRVKTSALLERIRRGEADAPLAVLAVVAREDEAYDARVREWQASTDAIVRLHAAAGLASSPQRDAVGKLANAYEFETDATVRLAVVRAMGARRRDADAPERGRTLGIAAQFDPDGRVRAEARRSLDGAASTRPNSPRELAWLHLDAPSPRGRLGLLVDASGASLPFAFDDDGYALVPAAPGEAQVFLAPLDQP